MQSLPKVTEPFDQLGRVGFVEFHVGKVVAQYRTARVSGEEEHELGFAQMERTEKV